MRRAHADRDADALAAIARRAYAPFVERIGRAPQPMLLDYRVEIAESEVWVAVAAGALVGFVVLKPADDRSHLLLDTIAVDPPRHGTGVGRELLQWAENRARELRLTEVRLYTNEAMTENLRLYHRIGYVETGRAVSNGYHRVYLAKRLD
ncbi:MAG: GNAT family N-acetyltransferase [Kineosporiaceae bacterium]|nr:GNAT family N-acetyltransferase [Kineosporiaceae bacterium]MBK8078020.1 GNAT family N-acetyltransferase [Kineosporiaceae bacterium]